MPKRGSDGLELQSGLQEFWPTKSARFCEGACGGRPCASMARGQPCGSEPGSHERNYHQQQFTSSWSHKTRMHFPPLVSQAKRTPAARITQAHQGHGSPLFCMLVSRFWLSALEEQLILWS